MTTIDFNIYDAGVDIPDSRDVQMALDMTGELPASIMHDHTPVLNQ